MKEGEQRGAEGEGGSRGRGALDWKSQKPGPGQ